MAAAAAKERRGDKGDSTMSGADLAAAVKFVHLKKSMKGWSSYSTVKKRVQFLEALSPAWTELVVCDAPAATPVLAAAALPGKINAMENCVHCHWGLTTLSGEVNVRFIVHLSLFDRTQGRICGRKAGRLT